MLTPDYGRTLLGFEEQGLVSSRRATRLQAPAWSRVAAFHVFQDEMLECRYTQCHRTWM